MPGRRVVITGGAGFIGSRLAVRLRADGDDVVVVDSLLPQVHGDAPVEPPGEFVRADVRDGAALGPAFVGADVVHHLAAETGVGQSQYEVAEYVSANVVGTATVLEEAVRAGVEQVTIASSRAVYGEGAYRCDRCGAPPPPLARRPEDLARGAWELTCTSCSGSLTPVATAEDAPLAPTSVYGVTKLQQEQLAAVVGAAHGVNVTNLRLFNVFGPGQSLRNPYVGVLGVFLRALRNQQPIDLYEDGKMLRDFVYVDDVVETFVRVTGEPSAFGRTWNVGSGAPVTLEELMTTLAGALGVEPKAERTGHYRVGDVRHVFADVARLDAELRFRPATAFADGVRAFVDWAAGEDLSADDGAAAAELRARNLLRQAPV